MLLPLARLVAITEGISYLLFSITMPLKYLAGIPEPNYIIGMIHGVMFIAYLVLIASVARQYNWNLKKTFIALSASLIPLATFFVDTRYLKPVVIRG